MKHLLIAIFVLLTAAITAQTNQNQSRGFSPDHVFQRASDVDSINLFNGNLTVTIPIGAEYPVGELLSYRLTLVYSGNVWDFQEKCPRNQYNPAKCYLQVLPNRASNAGWGWLLSLGRLILPTDDSNVTGDWWYEAPDGSRHEFTRAGYTDCADDPPSCATPGVFGVWVTQDNSFLRLRQLDASREAVGRAWYDIEFPDGTTHRFAENGSLQAIRDRFSNTLSIDYETGDEWILRDSQGRSNKIRFKLMRYDKYGADHRSLVSSVELATFAGTTATYTFNYKEITVHRPGDDDCADDFPDDSSTLVLNQLASVTLPDGTSYSMPSYFSSGSATNCMDGHLLRLDLPTGGHISWNYDRWEFPPAPALPPLYTEPPPTAWNYSVGIKSREVFTSGDVSAGRWGYTHSADSSSLYYPYCPGSWLRTTVSDPLSNVTEHSFAGYQIRDQPGGQQSCHADIYGLPFDPTQPSGSLYLSERRCGPSCSSSVLQQRYVLYETSAGSYRRLRQSKDLFMDDTTCAGVCSVTTTNDDYDGFGHFRSVTLSSNFPRAISRTTFTDYNSGSSTSGTKTVNEQQVPFFGAGDDWLPEQFGLVTKTTGGEARKSLSTFENGVLKTVRIARNTASSAPKIDFSNNDVLIARCRDGNGYLTSERWFGGDRANRTSLDFEPCATAAAAGEYQIDYENTFSGGTRTKRVGAYSRNKAKVVDEDYDANTGLVSAKRDSTGLVTSFTHDSMGRIKSQTSPGEAELRFIYEPNARPASIEVKRIGTDLPDTLFYFDGLGRLFLRKQRQPSQNGTLDENWSAAKTTYDSAGRIATRTTSDSSTNGTSSETTFSGMTTFGYDALGRPTSVTSPDGAVATTSYTGSRVVTRTTNGATTTETYDSLGHLASVKEPSGANDADVTTNYTYDIDDHLVNVSTTSGTTTQSRSWDYDGGGFLTRETHPELGDAPGGAVSYSTYDARGHARRKVVGSEGGAFDVQYTFDEAERLTKIEDFDPSLEEPTRRPVKEFVFGPYNDSTASRRGRLTDAIRHNYNGTADDRVTETFTYDSSSGRVSQRDTTVARVTNGNPQTLRQFTQSQTYDATGNVATSTYPACSSCSGTPPFTSITNTYSFGFLRSVTAGTRVYSSTIDYSPDGMPHQIVHGTNGSENVADTYARDATGIARPAEITFDGWAGCTIPSTPSITAPATLAPNASGTGSIVPQAGATYAWTIHGGSPTSSSSQPSITYTADTSGAVELSVTVTKSCGSATASLSIPICSAPATPAIAAPSTICPNATSGTASVASLPGISYEWSITGGSITSGASSAAIIFASGGSGSVVLNVKITNSCGSANGSSTVAIASVAAAVSGDQFYTAGGPPAAIHADLTGNSPWQLTWSDNVSTTATLPAYTRYVTPSATTTYTIVSATDVDGCAGTASGSATVTVRPPAPLALSATTSASTHVLLQWSYVAAVSYRIERATRWDGPWSMIGSASTTLASDDPPVGVAPITFLYRVLSVNSAGVTSGPSPVDYATTAASLFSDDPLAAGMPIRAVHLSELRRSVDAVRSAALLAPAWSDYSPPVGATVYATDFNEILTRLNEASTLLVGHGIGLTAPVPASGAVIYASTIQQLRDGVK